MARLPSAVAALPVTVFGSTSANIRELIAADTALRMPLPLCRRFGVVHVRGGAGASTTAAAVANTLARRRAGMVLGVNASAGASHLLPLAGLPGSAEQTDEPSRLSPHRAADAVAGLPRTPGGLYAYDLLAGADRDAPAPSSVWFENVTPISRFFDAVVTDWGVRAWQLDLGQVAAASHTVCIVARADRHAAEEAASVIPAMLDHEDRPAVVLALVDVGGGGERVTADIVADAGAPVVWIPYDAARGGRRAVGSRSLSTRSRIAIRRLTMTLLTSGIDR
jgi:MinD-like ATPase involved in chromosome partitioning or flagellar assembly